MSATLTRKETIYREAARLFREKGYRASSMRDLAQRVGLEASSLYNHIRSKEEILQDICFSNAEKFLQGMRVVELEGGSPPEQVEALIRLHIRIAIDAPTSITVFNDEWRHLSEPHHSRFLSMRRDYEQRFLDILRKGIENDFFRKVNPTTALYTLLTSLRWMHYSYSEEKNGPEEEVARDVLQLLLGGLEKPVKQ